MNRIVLGLIFGLLVCFAYGNEPRAFYTPITVNLDFPFDPDYNCSFGEGNHHPNNELGLSLLRIAQNKYEQGYSDNSGAFPGITQDQIEGFAHPLTAPIQKYFHHPRNFPVAVGVASDIFSDHSFFFGGTSDSFAFEKMFGGYPLSDTFGEIYSFILCKCTWELRGIAKSGFAFSTAQHYSFPPCSILKKMYCNKRKDLTVKNPPVGSCPEYPAPAFCGKEVIVLFGGTNGTHYSNKLVFYDPRSGAMAQIPANYSGVTPDELRLAGHASFIAGDSLYVVGGLRQVSGVRAPVISNNIYRFNLNTLIWTVVAPASTSFPNLAFHTVNHYGSFTPIGFYAIGGGSLNGLINNNIYQVNINPIANTYTVTTVPTPTGAIRPATFAHSAQVNSNNIFVYGGGVYATNVAAFPPSNADPQLLTHEFTPSAELWRYNIPTNTWVNLTQIHPYLGTSAGPVMLEYNDELLIYGGVSSSFSVNTGVFRISVNNPTYVTRPCCAPGYEGKNCEIPICSNNCGGPLIGKCVAPDTCECFGGFTGDSCEHHTCSQTFDQDLISLNDVLFYPKASANIINKIDQILMRLRFFRKNLRPWRSNALQTKYASIAESMYEFNTQNLDKFFNELQDEVQSYMNLRT